MKLVHPKYGSYRTESPAEITRLKSAGYREEDQAEDLLFHPADHAYGDVITHMQANPLDVERVQAEERDGKQRVTILEYVAP